MGVWMGTEKEGMQATGRADMIKEMETEQDGPDTLSTAIRGTRAAIDYTGLVTWSILSRGSCAIKDEILKIGGRVGPNAAEPFIAVKNMIRKGFGKQKGPVYEEMKRIEERISVLEERLIFLEKHGVRIAETPDYQKKQKELDEERRGLLSLIVKENKELRTLLAKSDL